MKVFVTGATGFVGSHLTPALLEAGHQVQALLEPGTAEKLAPAVREHAGFTSLTGDICDPASIEAFDPEVEAVVHLVGIIEEKKRRGITFERLHVDATRILLQRAVMAGVKRFVHVSALGTHERSQSYYHQSKYRAEALVKSSGLSYAILRPSAIFGSDDSFLTRLEAMVRPHAPVVIPGSGRNLLQPVAVENIVEGLVKSLDPEKAHNAIFEIGGPDRLSFSEIIDRIAEAKGIGPPLKLRVPLALALPAMFVLQFMPFVDATYDQIVMFRDDNVCDPRPFFDRLEIDPVEFRVDVIQRLLQENPVRDAPS